MYTYSINMWY